MKISFYTGPISGSEKYRTELAHIRVFLSHKKTLIRCISCRFPSLTKRKKCGEDENNAQMRGHDVRLAFVLLTTGVLREQRRPRQRCVCEQDVKLRPRNDDRFKLGTVPRLLRSHEVPRRWQRRSEQDLLCRRSKKRGKRCANFESCDAIKSIHGSFIWNTFAVFVFL